MADGERYDASVVAALRQKAGEGRTLKSLGVEFRVPYSTVQRICADVPKPRENRGRKRGMQRW